jgi:hypothetical protein
MNAYTKASILCAAAIGLGTLASPALAADTLNLSGPTTGVVGQPLTYQVSGNNYFDPSYGAAFWYSVGVISTSVVQACPADASDGIQLATGSGGDVPVFTSQETVDWDGNFSQTFAYTPWQAGSWLVCAYTKDLTGYTLAAAAQGLDVSAAGTGTGAGTNPSVSAKPTNAKAPRITRSGRKLVCSPGRWSDATGNYAYGWSIDGKRSKSAHARQLRITRRVRGHKVACSVTASNAAGSTRAVSRAVRV